MTEKIACKADLQHGAVAAMEMMHMRSQCNAVQFINAHAGRTTVADSFLTLMTALSSSSCARAHTRDTHTG